MMESLSLSEDRHCSGRPNTRRSRNLGHHSPCLPTPEPTRSNDELAHDEFPEEEKHTDLRTHELCRRFTMDAYANPSDGQNDDFAVRRDSGCLATPHSPPYHAYDGQRPSLPPLKTVLGDNISSPPHTPITQGVSQQPSPQEPKYTSTTYKPPSLYPNKKQRMDSVVGSTVSFTTASSFRSPGPSSTLFESAANTMSTRRDAHYSASSPQNSFAHTRRQFTEHQEPLHCRPASTENTQLYTPSYRDERHFSSNRLRDLAPDRRVSEQAPISDRPRDDSGGTRGIDNTTRAMYAIDARDALAQRHDFTVIRRSSINGYGGHITRPLEHNHARHSSHHPDMHYPLHVRAGFVEREPITHFEHSIHHLASARPDFDASPYSTHSAFSTPSRHEYHHSKARKRSNLPKQSTEIMKTWFDLNIANPYPTEDQKAIFSNATGISMTQVSNWFINHRRRCPELRDKRDKNRGREFEA